MPSPADTFIQQSFNSRRATSYTFTPVCHHRIRFYDPNNYHQHKQIIVSSTPTSTLRLTVRHIFTKAISSSCKRLMLCTHTGAQRHTHSLFCKAAHVTFAVKLCPHARPRLPLPPWMRIDRLCSSCLTYGPVPSASGPVNKTNGEAKLENFQQGADVVVSQWIHRSLHLNLLWSVSHKTLMI